MFSKTIVQALAISAVAAGVAAQACPESGPGASLFKSCGEVQGSMNVCTTGAVTACSCSVLQNEMDCYSSYKENYCSTWNHQNDYFSANCGANLVSETSSTKSDKPASTSATATATAEASSSSSASASASDSSSSSSAASSRSSASASASAAATGSAGSSTSSAAASASRSGSSAASSAAASASSSTKSASGSASTPKSTPSASADGSNAAGVFGVDSLLMAGGLLAALF